MLVAAVSVAGLLIGFVDDRGHAWSLRELQWLLLVTLAVVTGLAWLRPRPRRQPLRRQLVAIILPMALLAVFFFAVTTFLTAEPAFYNPVSYLMGHAVAEDNAKWLDFTAQLASGGPIVQAVALGGPLQLVLVFMATALSVVSSVVLGGVNEVAVAANAVIFGEFLLVTLLPLSLAPIAVARIRRASGLPGGIVPAPMIWVSALVLVAASLAVTALGHLTLQYTFVVAALWSSTFLANPRVPRALLLTSLSVAATMTVWLPLNVLAVVLLIGCLVVLVARPIRLGMRSVDVVGLVLWLVVAIALWEPIRSSLAYFLGTATAAGSVGAGAARGIAAVVHAPEWAVRMISLSENSLFSSAGGTEAAGPILAGLCAAAAVTAVVVLSRGRASDRSVYVRFAPAGLLALFALAITMLDLWTTGDGPHYGALKFTFLTVIVILATTLPFALLALDRGRIGMTPARWAGVGAVVLLLAVDTLLPRALASARPDQWSPPIPFDNPASYWWPADVNGQASQPIAENPVACVYLPPGAKVPSALMESGLSDPQRVYSCTRLIAGLAGSDSTAQPLVDWLRREWLTNTPAWSEVYNGLVAMPDSVQDKPVILLDEGSNVIGLETVRSLLERFPQYAGKTPEELAAINAAQ